MASVNNIIAFQGLEGAYSHLACNRVYPDMQAVACPTFAEAMFMVERGDAALAMIPLENSTAGRVEEIYRMMPKNQLHILAEHFEPVNHCLLGLQGVDIAEIKTVSSHPQALAQCAQHIKQLNIEPIAGYDTAGLAYDISQAQDPSRAAIASSLAAELYQLDVLQENFQDVAGNTTRFLILSNKAGLPDYDPQLNYVTSLMFTVRNIPAALYKALGGFATNGVNLLKVESYMANSADKGSQFHLDLAGHPENPLMKLALNELAFFTEEMRILGTYLAHSSRHD